MEKQFKKDIEDRLTIQLGSFFNKVDSEVTLHFSKHIKNCSKELTKKFLKTQKKLQNQLLFSETIDALLIAEQHKKENIIIPIKRATTPKKASSSKAKTAAPKTVKAEPKTLKAPVKKATQKGHNLLNSFAIQNKAKKATAKTIKTTKK